MAIEFFPLTVGEVTRGNSVPEDTTISPTGHRSALNAYESAALSLEKTCPFCASTSCHSLALDTKSFL